MNSRLFVFGTIVLLSLLFISYSTLQTGFTPVYINDDAFGFAHAGERPEDYPFLEKTGAEWVRQTFRWDAVNPSRELGRFDRFDHLMDMADENHIKVIAVLAYDVGWIHPYGT